MCGFCRKPVAFTEPAIEALNRTYHDGCFQCRSCHIPLAGKQYYNKSGIPLCEACYQVRGCKSVKHCMGPHAFSLTHSLICDNIYTVSLQNASICILGQSGTLLVLRGGYNRSRDPCTGASIPFVLFYLYHMQAENWRASLCTGRSWRSVLPTGLLQVGIGCQQNIITTHVLSLHV